MDDDFKIEPLPPHEIRVITLEQAVGMASVMPGETGVIVSRLFADGRIEYLDPRDFQI